MLPSGVVFDPFFGDFGHFDHFWGFWTIFRTPPKFGILAKMGIFGPPQKPKNGQKTPKMGVGRFDQKPDFLKTLAHAITKKGKNGVLGGSEG